MKDNLIDEIDSVLNECHKSGRTVINKSISSLRIDAINYASRHGFIFEKESNQYELTRQGDLVIESGSFLNYKSDVQKTQQREEIIKELTLKQLKGDIFQIKNWWLILLFSALLSFITGNFQLIISWFE